MSNTRFNDKSEITSITGAEFIPITDGTNDYKAEVQKIAEYTVSAITIGSSSIKSLISTNSANISALSIDVSALETSLGTTALTTSSQVVRTAINEVLASSKDGDIPRTPNSVNSAKVDASGYADYIAKVSDTSVVHYAGGTNPNIVETDVLGRTHTITADETITGMTDNGTYVMLKEYDLATGEPLASAPVAVLTANVSEAQILPSAGAGNDGKYITVTGVQPNRQYKGVSSAWVETTFIKRGQVTKTAGTMGTPSSYAFGSKRQTVVNDVRPAVVVETYQNGASWYRVWSDGWVEQGGRVQINASSNSLITLLKSFKDTNYHINFSHSLIGTGNQAESAAQQTSTSTIKLFNACGNSQYFSWEAKGY